MRNEVIWLFFMLFSLCFLIGLYRLFGKKALFAIIVGNIILCNIQVTKMVNMFGLVTSLGNILYASIFLATDILDEFWGPTEARKGILLGFFTLIFMTIAMQFGLKFKPDVSDFVHPALETIFSIMPRIAAGSLIAYLVSQTHDVWAFDFWKRRYRGRYLWLRNNASTMVSQAIDTVIFCSIAFLGIFPSAVFLQIVLTTYLFKGLVAVVDTPFIYWAKRIGCLE